MTAQTLNYNPSIVACLRIAYRRGLAVMAAERERERQAADVSMPGSGDTSAATTPDLDARRDGHDTTV